MKTSLDDMENCWGIDFEVVRIYLQISDLPDKVVLQNSLEIFFEERNEHLLYSDVK